MWQWLGVLALVGLKGSLPNGWHDQTSGEVCETPLQQHLGVMLQ